MKLTEEQKQARKTRNLFYERNDVLQMNSAIKKGKNSDLPFLSKKGVFLVNYLLKNDIEKNY